MLLQIQDILNMLCTLQKNKKLTLNEEIKVKYTLNKTLIVQLGTKVMTFITSDAWNTFAHHCNEAFISAIVLHHDHLLKNIPPTSQDYRLLG